MPEAPEMPKGEIYEAIERFRRDLLRRERKAASEMVRVYGDAWQRIRAELERLNTEYEAMKARGEKPGPDWIYQYNRARAFRNQVLRELQTFAQYAENKVREEQIEAIRTAEEQAERLTRLALRTPPAGLTIDWNCIDRASVETLLGMTQADSPLHRLLLSISGNGTQAAEDALVQGMLLGKNPREVAREMRRALGVTLSRALTIARTETLRAHREATRASYQANSDIVTGWIWHSAADERTCAACWAMHGTEHKTSETFDSHPNCRCVMIPQTRTWAEIGKQYIDLSDVPDTNPEIEPGVSLFERLPAEKQIRILGPAKWAAWKEGEFSLSDIVGRSRSKAWGTHRYEKSLAELLGAEKAKGYTRLALMGVARNAGRYSADDLIRVAGLGLRELTPEELKRIVQHVAKAGFDPNGLEKCGGRLAGLVWNGKTLKGNDTLSPGEAHYLRHVVKRHEWPANTTLNEYYQSLREVIEDENSGIVVHKIGSEWQIGFLNSSGKWRGQEGRDTIFVDYRISISHWVTGFQPKDIDNLVTDDRWSNVQWIRPFKAK